MKTQIAMSKMAWTCVLVLAFASNAFAGFNVASIGGADSFAVLYEGSGSHNLQINSSAVVNQYGTYSIEGNIGLGNENGGDPVLQLDNPAVVYGNVYFAAAEDSHNDNIGNGVLHGTVSYGVSAVDNDLNLLNSLSTTLGAESGTPLAVNLSGTGGSQTINASSGGLDSSGNRIFTLNSMTFNNGNTLYINGDSAGDSVVINVTTAVNTPHFAGSIILEGGLTWDKVLINVLGGNSLTLSGGNSLQTSANNAYQYATYLDPNGNISMNSVNIIGHVFGGDSQDMQIVSGATIAIPETAPGSVVIGAFCLLSLALTRKARPRASAVLSSL